MRKTIIMVCVCLFAGCGSGSKQNSSSQVRKTINEYYSAAKSGNAQKACGLLSPPKANCEVGVALAGPKLKSVKVTISNVKITGATATATVKELKTENFQLKKEGGAWKIDSAHTGAQEPPAVVVGAWPERWCQAKPGISKAALVSLMGQPTEQTGDTLDWRASGYDFTAFLDSRGNVSKLDIDLIGLSAQQRAKVHCAETR